MVFIELVVWFLSAAFFSRWPSDHLGLSCLNVCQPLQSPQTLSRKILLFKYLFIEIMISVKCGLNLKRSRPFRKHFGSLVHRRNGLRALAGAQCSVSYVHCLTASLHKPNTQWCCFMGYLLLNKPEPSGNVFLSFSFFFKAETTNLALHIPGSLRPGQIFFSWTCHHSVI